MTCAQGLLRLLWGGPEVGVLRDCRHIASERAANNIAPDGGLIEVASQLCRYYFLHGNIAIALFQHNYYLRSWKLCVIIRFFFARDSIY